METPKNMRNFFIGNNGDGEWRQWCCYGVFIVKSEQISQIVLVLPLLSLKKVGLEVSLSQRNWKQNLKVTDLTLIEALEYFRRKIDILARKTANMRKNVGL